MKYVVFLVCVSSLFVFTQCKSKSKGIGQTKPPVDTHVLVELKEGVGQKVLRDYLNESYEIKSIRPSNRTLNQYIFHFMILKEERKSLLTDIRAQTDVIKAEIVDPNDLDRINIQPSKTGTSKPVFNQK